MSCSFHKDVVTLVTLGCRGYRYAIDTCVHTASSPWFAGVISISVSIGRR